MATTRRGFLAAAVGLFAGAVTWGLKKGVPVEPFGECTMEILGGDTVLATIPLGIPQFDPASIGRASSQEMSAHATIEYRGTGTAYRLRDAMGNLIGGGSMDDLDFNTHSFWPSQRIDVTARIHCDVGILSSPRHLVTRSS